MRKQAFTLIELMIVVAIVAFLATISIPQYFRYQAKAKQTEVAMNLASLHTAQQAYFAEHGEYTKVLWGEGGIGWRPEGYKGGGKNENFYYTYGFNFPGAKEGIHFFTGKLGTAATALGNTTADKSTFIVKAAGDLNGKGKIDLWKIDDSRRIEHEVDGIE